MKGKNRLFLIMGIVGPGLIIANGGNDAAGVIIYSLAGGNFGYSFFLWIIGLTLGFAAIQEMIARMAVVTGKGLSDLIRERFGAKWAFLVMALLLVSNFAISMANFLCIALSLEMFNISRYLSVPASALLIWFIITKVGYSKGQKIFFILTCAFLTFLFAAVTIKPNPVNIITGMLNLQNGFNKGFFLTMIAILGTTITPFMHFYIQSSIVEKEISLKEYFYEKLNVYITVAVAGIFALLIMACSTEAIFKTGGTIKAIEDVAMIISPFAKEYSQIILALGLLGAALTVCSIVPITTAYSTCEALGFESGEENKINEAPVFFGILIFIVFGSGAAALIPGLSLLGVILISAEISGFLCPIMLIFIIKLANDKEVMGLYTNTFMENVFAKGTVILSITLIAGLFISII